MRASAHMLPLSSPPSRRCSISSTSRSRMSGQHRRALPARTMPFQQLQNHSCGATCRSAMVELWNKLDHGPCNELPLLRAYQMAQPRLRSAEKRRLSRQIRPAVAKGSCCKRCCTLARSGGRSYASRRARLEPSDASLRGASVKPRAFFSRSHVIASANASLQHIYQHAILQCLPACLATCLHAGK